MEEKIIDIIGVDNVEGDGETPEIGFQTVNRIERNSPISTKDVSSNLIDDVVDIANNSNSDILNNRRRKLNEYEYSMESLIEIKKKKLMFYEKIEAKKIDILEKTLKVTEKQNEIRERELILKERELSLREREITIKERKYGEYLDQGSNQSNNLSFEHPNDTEF